MIKIYEYYSKGFACNVQLSYKSGVLCDVKIDNSPLETEFTEENTEDKRAYFFVFEVCFLAATKGKTKVTEINREVSFDMFWNRYAYKSSGKIEAERSWKKLNKLSQLSAFDYIPQYEAILKLNPVSKMYASTYLNNKRWEK